MRPLKRPHRRTGRPKGPPPGSRNGLKDGLKAAAMIENRRLYVALMKAAREVIREMLAKGPAP